MTKHEFLQFLADYRATYGPIGDSDMVVKLGVSRSTYFRIKKRGGDRVLALACAALMHNIKAYGDT